MPQLAPKGYSCVLIVCFIANWDKESMTQELKSRKSTQILEEQQALCLWLQYPEVLGIPQRFWTFICPSYQVQHQCAQRGGTGYGPRRFRTLSGC
jgi:hypothetical protein